jgi:hypothetical protein
VQTGDTQESLAYSEVWLGWPEWKSWIFDIVPYLILIFVLSSFLHISFSWLELTSAALGMMSHKLGYGHQ